MEEDGHGKRVSSSAVSSRLSAKAQPFRLNRFTAQPTWTSSLTSVDPCDSLIKSLSNVNLEEDPLPSASNFGLDSLQGSWFGQHSDSDSLACTNYAYETLLEQGKPVKKSKLYDENSESVHEKCSPPDIMDLHQLLYGEGKKTDHDKSLSDKGNERKCGKPVSSEGSDPLLTDKSDPQITLEKFYDKSSSEHQDAEAAVSLSTKLDGNDSDVDSPCWRGSLASRQTPLGVSRSLSSHSIENVQEASYSLNPLAPHFFPRPSKAIVNCYANEYDADDFSSFKKSESGAVGAVSSFSKENESVDKAGSKLSLSLNGMGTQTSNDIHEPKREYALLDKSGSYSALSEGISKLLSTDSKIDVSTVLNMMHDLSSFLVQNCSNDVLLNDHDLIQHIINNLCMCFQHRAGGKTPMPDFTVSGTPYFPNKSTEIIEAGVCVSFV